MTFTRRSFIAASLAAPLALHLRPALAASTRPKGQVLPVQRFAVGDSVVSAFSDGHLAIDLSLLSNIEPGEAKALLAAAFRGAPPVTTGVNAYIVHMPDRTVLIDTGGAGAFPDLGKLEERLEAAGLKPEDVTDVLLTHLHPDHVGGLAIGGKPTFPNAAVHVNAAEYDYWTSAANRAAAPDAAKGFFDIAAGAMQAAGDKVKTFAGDGEVVPGITARELFGHTPGHTGYMIGEGEAGLLVWGDIVHVAPIQFPRPGVGIAFDTDPQKAIATRKALLKDVAEARTRIAGMHIAFPSVGHVRAAADAGSYEFVPADWDYVIE
ncbi:MBL fold metallo-hydrolase [Jiella sonneratiae]|uniref:MBL fold metallo-hydrolase n=1 Tax=Jiella sonneratiae TaxID=2816856 RepID=A0ABS3J0H4_9HYPH|nr:MBL fold metallo-hydrolase [Jiella sonneratiae]MBO0903179.1 MBL fold metallo-hydrolase [Jiella sonneratiae]